MTVTSWKRTSTKENFLRSSALRRWGGAGAALGGALFAVWGYLHGNIVLSSAPVVAAAMGLLIDILLLVGVAGLCAWWREGRTGWLGALGFVLCFAGAALNVAHGVHAFVIASGIAEPAPWYVYTWAVLGLPAYVFHWLPILPVGLATVGIGSIRLGTLGGWGILPLAMGLLGGAYQLTDVGGILETSFAHVPFGAGYSLGWFFLGYLLWRQGTATNAYTSQR